MGGYKVTFRITIISLYLILSFIMMAIVFLSMAYFDHVLTKTDIAKEFYSMETNARKALSNIDKANSSILEIFSVYSDTGKDFHEADKNNLLKLFHKLLKNNPKLSSVYIGYENGDFYELLNLDTNKSLPGRYGASADDKWVIVSIFTESGRYVKKFDLLDAELNRTSSATTDSDYDPRTRLWYKKAFSESTVIKTEPYNFSNFDGIGITYAFRPEQSRNVLAVDVLTDSMGEMLNSYKFTDSSEVYLIDGNKKIYASTEADVKSDNLIADELVTASGKLDNQDSLHYTKNTGGQKYFFHIRKFTAPMGDVSYLGMATPYNDAIYEFRDRGYKILYACIGTLMIMVPVIFYLVSFIVRPIAMLKNESDKVSKREFDKICRVHTRLIEIHQLSDSIFVMSKSIQDYQQNLEQKIEERTKELENKNIQLEKLSVTDKLTGVFNRIKLDSVLENEVRRAERYEGALSLIILDIDHFKTINDTYGHQTGDSVLAEFANLLKSSVRVTDTVGRWGGEEFLIICPETDGKGVFHMAESIREKIEAHNFETAGRVTASLGTATYRSKEKEKDMISRADKGLYEAKKSGRNRTVTVENVN